MLGLLLAGAGCLAQGQIPHRFLLGDEGNQNLHLMDTGTGQAGWTVPLPGNGRDMQLIGNNRVLISTPAGGYLEIDLAHGAVMKQVKSFGGVQTARRLPNGHTLLAGDDLQGSQGITVLELDAQDRLVHKTVFPGMNTLRLLRLTPAGNLLFGSKERLIEADTTGKILWEAQIPGASLYKTLRLANGDTWASTGYGISLVRMNSDKKILKTISGSSLHADVKAHFFGDFQLLPNGHLVVTNWQNHGPGHGAEGIQLLEFDSTGSLVSKFYQDPARYSSLHSVLVLDGLDLARLHDERAGFQVPFPATVLGSVRRSRAHPTGRPPSWVTSRFTWAASGPWGRGWVLGKSEQARP